MIRTVGTACLALVIGVAAVGCTSNSTSPSSSASASSPSALTSETEAKLQQVLDSVRADFGFPGVQAGVWVDGQGWTGTSGTAKQGTDQAITAADHTRIGSITKTVTATVVLQLISEGKLSFDDVVDKFVKGMPNGSTATIRNLLQMQSGIPTYTANEKVINKWAKNPQAAWTPQQLADSVKGEKPMFKPGEAFFYSNTNFVLLGMIIEQVTGKSIADNFQERVFTPLGLDQTSVPGSSTTIPSPFLSGVSEQADPDGTVKDATNWNPSFAFTAGELISTIDDLHKWGVALGTGEKILSPEMQKLRVESVNTTVPPNQPTRSYGLGIVNTDGWLGHTGEIPGYNTVVNYKIDSKTTIAVMVNSDITKGDPRNPASAPAVAVFQGLVAALNG